MQSQFKKLHWGVMQIPTRVAGQAVVPPLGGEVWTIPKTTPARERAAFNVLKEMAEPSNVLPLAKGLSDVPTRTSLWNESTWRGPEYAAFFEELKHGRSRTRDLTADYPQVETIIGNATASALIGKTPAKKAFDSAKHDIEKVLHS
jgi:multiple sugar transport system substrate-binding protein